MSHTLIIGLSGKAGAGKDTAADALVQRMGFVRVAFADALREEVAQAWGLVEESLLTRRETKELVTQRLCAGLCTNYAFVDWCFRLGHAPFVALSPRWVMQHWGEWRREQDPYYWVDQVTGWIRQQIVNGRRHIVVTDCRYRNEARALQNMGGVLVRIHRPQITRLSAAAAHDSERADFGVDHHIHNDATPTELADAVCDLALSLKACRPLPQTCTASPLKHLLVFSFPSSPGYQQKYQHVAVAVHVGLSHFVDHPGNKKPPKPAFYGASAAVL